MRLRNVNGKLKFVLAVLLLVGIVGVVTAKTFDERWVFVMGSLRDESMWPGASNAVV